MFGIHLISPSLVVWVLNVVNVTSTSTKYMLASMVVHLTL